MRTWQGAEAVLLTLSEHGFEPRMNMKVPTLVICSVRLCGRNTLHIGNGSKESGGKEKKEGKRRGLE